MDTQPKIPTLKDSQKPQVKVRGLEAGMTLFDRLKQFKKKDLAFILAGLGTLFMAPLAEHFMMSPEAGDGTLQQGWKGGAKGIFDGSGSNPYEVGSNNGMAPGGPTGGGSDIITPLNVRDPSALVMGPGATQQPPTNSVMPSTPPPTAPNTRSDSDLKDALAAGARGAGAAVKRALLPIPPTKLQAGVRGLGVANGGSNASAGPISSAGLVSGKAANGGNFGGIRGGNNIKGVSRGQSSGDGDDKMAALRKAADAAAGLMNRGGAAAALEEAAKAGMPSGNGSGLGGSGAGGSGATDKATGGDQNKDGKNVGESLEFLKAKAIQEAKIDLWKKEQEAGDNRLELLKMRNSMGEAIAGKIGGAVGDLITCPITSGKSYKTCFNFGGGVTSYSCISQGVVAIYQSADVGTDPKECDDKSDKGTSTAGKHYYLTGDNMNVCPNKAGFPGTGCKANDGSKLGDGKTPPPGGSVGGFDRITTDPSITKLVDICNDIKGSVKAANEAKTAITPDVQGFYDGIQAGAQNLIAARDAMFKGANGDLAQCGGSGNGVKMSRGDKTYASALEAATLARDTTASPVAKMLAVVPQSEKPDTVPGNDILTALKTAEDHRANAVAIMADASAKADVKIDAKMPPAWGPDMQAKGQKYVDQLHSAQDGLKFFKMKLDEAIADGADQKGKGMITTQHDLLDAIVKGDKDNKPTLPNVVATNTAYAAAEKSYHTAANDPDKTEIKAAEPDKNAAKPGADLKDTQKAIDQAKSSVGNGDGQGAAGGAIASVKAFAGPPVDDKAKAKAAEDLGKAKLDVQQMQESQKAVLTKIGDAVKAEVLPTGDAAAK